MKGKYSTYCTVTPAPAMLFNDIRLKTYASAYVLPKRSKPKNQINTRKVSEGEVCE